MRPAKIINFIRGASAGKGRTACMLGYFSYDYDARIQNYVNILARNGYSVDIIGLGKKSYVIDNGDTKISFFAVKDRVLKERNIYQLMWHLVHFFILASVKVSILHLKKRYRFIHVHNVPDNLVFTALIPKLLGAKVILDIHDILPEFYARKFNASMDSKVIKTALFVEKMSCRFADHVVIANDIWRDRVAKRSAPDWKCTSILNYPDTSLFQARRETKRAPGNGVFKMMYHGTITEHNGVDIAVRAAVILKDKIDGFKMVFIGAGAFENGLKDLARSLGVEKYVDVLRGVPLQELPEILAGVDMGIEPKKDGVFIGEAMSTKLFQCAAMGIPVVSSRTPAQRRYFEEDEVKFFKPGDPADMARCILEMYENPALREAMAKRALKRMDVYSLKANEAKYMGLIASLTGNG